MLLALIGRGPKSRRSSAERRGVWHGHPPTKNKERLRKFKNHLVVRKEISVPHLMLAAIPSIVLVWMAWHIVADTAAENLAPRSPEIAIKWMGTNSAALDRLALQELATPTGNIDAAETWAQRALRANPMDEQALYLLGVAAERKGDKKNAVTLMRIAGARTWRDLGTQLWLFEEDSRRADYAGAITHADAIFRVNPELMPQIFPALAAVTTNPRGLRSLADFLATDPPWRQWVVESLAGRLYDKSHLDELYSMLSESRSPPTKRELKAYLDRLIKDGRYQFAYKFWRGALPPDQQAEPGFLYNGRFDLPLDETPFNWVLRPIVGAESKVASTDGSEGHALLVEFSGARVNFANVEQLLLLPPGHYRLSGMVMANDLRTERGLWWHVFCAPAPQTELAHTELVSGSIPWTEFGVEFDVPANRCDAQTLQLTLPGRVPSERQIEGQIWYKDIRINPILPIGKTTSE